MASSNFRRLPFRIDRKPEVSLSAEPGRVFTIFSGNLRTEMDRANKTVNNRLISNGARAVAMSASDIFENILAKPKIDPYTNRNSIEFKFRERRFATIRNILKSIIDEKGSASILDLGGTETYWNIGKEFIEANRNRLHITIVNTLEASTENGGIFTYHQMSATDPDLFKGQEFDFVHSNSVIEHVGAYADMQAFADNTRRLAPRYYVQTPNYWFPYEPHFRFPGFQYLPERVRCTLIMRYSLGFFRRIEDKAEAEDIIQHHRLLSSRQMAALFPDAAISHEKFAKLNKSIIAIKA
ncbi:class I SAM-dependent methyltransferase [Pseudaminobacter salicylatoxidans]|nr:class I SAM-dependent methyltransferase [Pseudaminobacter salicylatoxidans]